MRSAGVVHDFSASTVGMVGVGLVSAAAWATIGCESGRVSRSGEPVPERTAHAARSARPSSSAARPAGSSERSVVSTVALAGGATVKLPPGAIERRKPGGLPDMVKGAHNFSLPGGRQRLMISELDLQSQTCAQRLDEEWGRMQAARKDQDPARLKLRRTTTIEQAVVAGHRVLYSESMQGTSLVDAGRPFAAMASAFMCEGTNLLLIMYMSDQAALDAKVKPMIHELIKSYQPPAAAKH